MKTIILGAVIVALSLPAHAISRYDTRRLSCERVQAILESEGAAILRYPSPRSSQLTLYDLYAKNSRHCQSGEVARPAFVPTANNSRCQVRRCQVRRCETRRHNGDN